MKTSNRYACLFAALFACVLALFVAVPAMLAQSPASIVALAMPLDLAISPTLAQIVPATVAQVAAPWYSHVLSDPAFLGWVFATASAIYAVFKRNDASMKTKALSAVIVGVEHATQLPAVQAAEKTVKESIQRFAVANGVEAELSSLVHQLTAALPLPPDAAPVATAPSGAQPL
jgi:hypothetical protein